MLDPPNSSWSPVIFLILFRANEANKGIHNDISTWCQYIWVASAFASIIPTICMLVVCCNSSSLPDLGHVLRPACVAQWSMHSGAMCSGA